MGAKKIDAVEWTCDACGKTVPSRSGTQPETWYTGSVTTGPVDDEQRASWAACMKSHIKGAVLGSLTGEPYPGEDDEHLVDTST